MNKVLLIGNITKKPDNSKTTNDLSVCRFTVAVPRNYKSNETDFFNVITWRALADNCARFLNKGSKVAISGSIQNRSYDATDGTKRYVTEIVADEVQFLSTRDSGENEASLDAKADDGSAIRDSKPVDDDIPF